MFSNFKTNVILLGVKEISLVRKPDELINLLDCTVFK